MDKKAKEIQVIMSYRNAALMKAGVKDIFCGECIYFRNGGDQYGGCVRRPPDREGWPTVRRSDRCGEWEQKIYTDCPCTDDYYQRYEQTELTAEDL
ncbi:hypothetical protein [Solidesulfovibrio magneticus]|uniref:hypothetical protein n=1 Tax=Solidesulfovibrio magneticus TaxID=184917 RepID=UPI0011D12A70|nr:hypothetical protein [Solidesulfovibrio magneticus]